MKIKRYFATTLREALKQVKTELGSDAVILSNNKVEGGIELVAAIDYDEKAFKDKHQPAKKMTSDKKPSQHSDEDNAFVYNPDKKRQQGVSTDWMSKLEQNKASKDPLSMRASKNDIKDDVISFSHEKMDRENKKDPVLKTSALQELINKDKFAHLINKESHINQGKDVKQNPFDFDALVGNEAATYQKPQVKTKAPIEDLAAVREQKMSAKKRSGNIEWSQDPILTSMKEDIQMLKGMMQNQISGLAWGEFNRSNPHRSELMQRLYKLGLKPSISGTILKQVDEHSNVEASWKKALSLISRGIKLAQEDIIDEGGMIALVGPTGVGKTTTLAKLVSRFVLQHGVSDVAIISMDSYRIGAQEQLKIYGQLLRVPVYIVSDEEELNSTLHRLAEKRLVLIDTAGMNQKDMRMAEQLSMLRKAHKSIKMISVLSASAQSYTVHEVIDMFKPYGLDGCIITKLDESTSLGGVMSVLIENQLQLHYVTDGQKVPEDIHPGRASNLLKQAMGIVRERKDAYDYNDVAMSFVGELMQA